MTQNNETLADVMYIDDEPFGVGASAHPAYTYGGGIKFIREDLVKSILDIGNQMANVMFNLAQRPGHALTSDDVALLDKLRKQWGEVRNVGK